MTFPGERDEPSPVADEVARAMKHTNASDEVNREGEQTMKQSREQVGKSRDAIAKTAEAISNAPRNVAETGRSAAETATGVVDEALDWLTAVGLGIRDTAKEMLDRGREGAREAYRDYWRQYDEKTVLRRDRPHAPSRDRKKAKKKRR